LSEIWSSNKLCSMGQSHKPSNVFRTPPMMHTRPPASRQMVAQSVTHFFHPEVLQQRAIFTKLRMIKTTKASNGHDWELITVWRSGAMGASNSADEGSVFIFEEETKRQA